MTKEMAVLESPRMRNYVRKVIRSRAIANQDVEDIAQDALLIALRNIRKYKHGNLLAWVGVIAQNHLNNVRKRRFACRDTAKLVPLTEDKHPVYVEPERSISQELQWALQDLTDEQRNALLLVSEGYSYDEIAQANDVPTGTVMSRLFRARRTVKQRLGEW